MAPSKLYFYHELPPVLQYNPYVNSGYRAGYSYRECGASILQLHNESSNIWSHLGPALVVLFSLLAGILIPWQGASAGFAAVVGSILVCMGCSVCYHTCMAHQQHYRFWITCDVMGIFALFIGGEYWISQWTFPCEPTLRAVMTSSYYLVAALAAAACLASASNLLRLAPMALLASFRWGVYVYRLATGVASPTATYLYLATEAFAILGGSINCLKIPERWAPAPSPWRPARFDYCCNSHNLMHLLVLGSFGCLYAAASLDATHYRTAGDVCGL